MQNTSSPGSTKKSRTPHLLDAFTQMAPRDLPNPQRHNLMDAFSQIAAVNSRLAQRGRNSKALLGIAVQIADANDGKVLHGPQPMPPKRTPGYMAPSTPKR